MKLQRLKELALGATQGEWKTVDHSWSDTGIYPENGGRLAVCEIDSSVTEDTQEHYEAINDANAAYIAAACPANILPFIESYEELLRELHYAKQYLPVSVVVRRSVYKAITNAEKLK